MLQPFSYLHAPHRSSVSLADGGVTSRHNDDPSLTFPMASFLARNPHLLPHPTSRPSTVGHAPPTATSHSLARPVFTSVRRHPSSPDIPSLVLSYSSPLSPLPISLILAIHPVQGVSSPPISPPL